MRKALLPMVLLLAACDILDAARPPTLDIVIKSYSSRRHWPPDEDNPITVNSLIYDPRGLQGLVVHLSGDLHPPISLTASFFTGGARHHSTVAPSGAAVVTMQVFQNGQLAVAGSVSWQLEPGVDWDLVVERTLAPSNWAVGNRDFSDVRCSSPRWCHARWRFPIDDAYANFDQEGLWVTLRRSDRIPCPEDRLC